MRRLDSMPPASDNRAIRARRELLRQARSGRNCYRPCTILARLRNLQGISGGEQHSRYLCLGFAVGGGPTLVAGYSKHDDARFVCLFPGAHSETRCGGFRRRVERSGRNGTPGSTLIGFRPPGFDAGKEASLGDGYFQFGDCARALVPVSNPSTTMGAIRRMLTSACRGSFTTMRAVNSPVRGRTPEGPMALATARLSPSGCADEA